jgi:hypothetical protein
MRGHRISRHVQCSTLAIGNCSIIRTIAVTIATIIAAEHISSWIVTAIAIQAPPFMSAVGVGSPRIIIEGVVPPRPCIEVATIEMRITITTIPISMSVMLAIVPWVIPMPVTVSYLDQQIRVPDTDV